MARIKQGDTVKQLISAPIQGTVSRITIDQVSGQLQYEVSWQDGEGSHAVVLNEDQVEAV